MRHLRWVKRNIKEITIKYDNDDKELFMKRILLIIVCLFLSYKNAYSFKNLDFYNLYTNKTNDIKGDGKKLMKFYMTGMIQGIAIQYIVDCHKDYGKMCSLDMDNSFKKCTTNIDIYYYLDKIIEKIKLGTIENDSWIEFQFYMEIKPELDKCYIDNVLKKLSQNDF